MKTSLLLLALTIANSYSAPIPINSVPMTISTPGTYQVTKNLICAVNTPAITINSPKAGKIILDLGGFSLAASGVNISGVYILNPTNSRIVVENGSLNSFSTGVQVNDAALATGWVTGILVENTVFNRDDTAVFFYQANGCSVTSCSFIGQMSFGIRDWASETGNKFLDNTFDGTQFTILSIGGGLEAPKVIDCRASVP